MKTFPHYLQLDAMDCDPTCLCMIAKYYARTIRFRCSAPAPSSHARGYRCWASVTRRNPFAGVSRTGVRIHRRKGGVHFPRARRTGKVRIGNSTAAGADHPLWQRTAFGKDHDGNGIHRHEGKKACSAGC
ncbi:hypothetical protein IMSAGC004_01557 [Bacteroidaceae bacterium]|nr:hypothetical protein IMSAGC004_01557 [Bacteroidaceae bacterium]